MDRWLGASQRFKGLAVGLCASDRSTYDYDQLWQFVQSMRQMIDRRSTPQAIVILGQKNVRVYACLLAALCDGNYFVPINPKWPKFRQQQVIESVGAKTIFYEERYKVQADALQVPTKFNLSEVQPVQSHTSAQAYDDDDRRLAYILFTSGSSGLPKGIQVSRANLSKFIEALQAAVPINSTDRLTQSYDLSFDLAVGEVFWALTAGASLFPLESVELSFLDNYLNRTKVTVWSSTPSLVQFMRAQKILSSKAAEIIRASLFCGEKLHAEIATAWKEKAAQSRVFNFYGPTETTVYATYHEWQPHENEGYVTIGKPLHGMEFKIVGEKGEIHHQAEIGELWLSGSQVAIGYLNDPDLTAQRFRLSDGKRWYLTGDLVKLNGNQEIEFIGRQDQQVKIQGYRLELGEIEVVAQSVIGHLACAVFAVPNPEKEVQIFMLISHPLKPDQQARLMQELASKLPSYALPTRTFVVSHWPLNENGKLDRPLLRMQLLQLLENGSNS